MQRTVRGRDFEAERRERDSFIVLQHLYTMGEECSELPVRRIADDLGLAPKYTEEIVENLITTGYLEWAAWAACVRPSPLGVKYIESLAWRRRSLRVSAVDTVGRY